MFQFILVLAHTLSILVIHICVLFFILLSLFRACLDHCFVLWCHTHILFNGFSSVFHSYTGVCCSLTVVPRRIRLRWLALGASSSSKSPFPRLISFSSLFSVAAPQLRFITNNSCCCLDVRFVVIVFSFFL